MVGVLPVVASDQPAASPRARYMDASPFLTSFLFLTGISSATASSEPATAALIMGWIQSPPWAWTFLAERNLPNGVSEMPSSADMEMMMREKSCMPSLRYASLSPESRYPRRNPASGNVEDRSARRLLADASPFMALMNAGPMDWRSLALLSIALRWSSALLESFFLTRSFRPSRTMASSSSAWDARTSMRGSSPPTRPRRIRL